MDQNLERQREHYKRCAGNYDEFFGRANPNHYYKIHEIGRYLFECPIALGGGRLDCLEVGAGSGIHAARLLHDHSGKIRRLVLADLSPEMLELARKRLGHDERVRLLVTAAERLETDDQFDAIYVSGSMHHFADPEKAIAELCGHLRPGGRLAVCEPIVYNPINLMKAAREREEWGQFRVQRGWVRQRLLEKGGRLVTDRVLHWKGSNPVLQRLWPYRRLERFSLLSPLAVMFLLVVEK